jgi:hypothetical protein
MRERVEAESPEAKRFLSGLRDILKVPKAVVETKLARRKSVRRRKKSARSKAATT